MQKWTHLGLVPLLRRLRLAHAEPGGRRLSLLLRLHHRVHDLPEDGPHRRRRGGRSRRGRPLHGGRLPPVMLLLPDAAEPRVLQSVHESSFAGYFGKLVGKLVSNCSN